MRMNFGAALRAAALLAPLWGALPGAAQAEAQAPAPTPAPLDDRPSLKVPPGLTETERGAVLSSGPWRRLNADEIREALTGKTLHYLLRGRSRGEESHSADGRAVWRMEDGVCLKGAWVAKGETLCYFYDDGSSGCWAMIEGPYGYRHRARGGGMPDVVVRRVSEEVVTCAPVPTS
ncbi:hypothetical protein [Neomegalonema perideroedes]|uniref:hypothetical protein n=1 Tax=Neomegalonema perideroedes TaxID=217219 RepID=UPI0012FD6A04|nr:hypothetical protein [Neomegalonema perideroedes]